jgi:hypothetical protein
MSASATKSEFATFLSRLDKWERTKNGSHSNLRDMTKKVQRRIAGILASLSDEESMVAFEAFGVCTICEQNKENDELNKLGTGDGISPRFRRWQTFVERHTGHKSDYQHAEYYALLAPVWNALNGTGDNPGYCMGQAIYTIRDEIGSMDIEPLLEGDRAKELRAKLIGIMMYNDALGASSMDYEDARWFGAYWRTIAPVWQMLKRDNIYDPQRVVLIIEHQRKGTPSSLMDGVL